MSFISEAHIKNEYGEIKIVNADPNFRLKISEIDKYVCISKDMCTILDSDWESLEATLITYNYMGYLEKN